MSWTAFFTFLIQGLIVLFIIAVVLFVGSAAWAAVKEQMNKND